MLFIEAVGLEEWGPCILFLQRGHGCTLLDDVRAKRPLPLHDLLDLALVLTPCIRDHDQPGPEEVLERLADPGFVDLDAVGLLSARIIAQERGLFL